LGGWLQACEQNRKPHKSISKKRAKTLYPAPSHNGNALWKDISMFLRTLGASQPGQLEQWGEKPSAKQLLMGSAGVTVSVSSPPDQVFPGETASEQIVAP